MKIELEITDNDIQVLIEKMEYIRQTERVYPHIKNIEMFEDYLNMMNEYYDDDKVLLIYNYFLNQDDRDILVDMLYRKYKKN